MSRTYHERKAIEDGYTFSGHYSFRQEEMKKAAEKLRAEGNKARVIYIPADKLSRSGGGGYSVYWIESEENKAKRLEEGRQRKIKRLLGERETLLKKVADIEAELKEFGGKLPIEDMDEEMQEEVVNHVTCSGDYVKGLAMDYLKKMSQQELTDLVVEVERY